MKDRYLYEHLVNTVGTEIDVRKRQQLFIIKDLMLTKRLGSGFTIIYSGSLAEGIDLPGSDVDIMCVIENLDVIQNVRNMKHCVQRTTLVMETDTDHPGFTRLRLIAGGDGENDFLTYEYFESTSNGLYFISGIEFLSKLNKMNPHYQLSQHGPCLSDRSQKFDFAYCLRSKSLPYNTISWGSRYRQQWPPNSTIDMIIKYGCLLVPIGPSGMLDCNVLWRLSFSVAEKLLVHSFNFTQLLCYCLLKLTLKRIVNINKHAEGLLCSYFLKTALFWVSEELDIDMFQLSKLFVCFFHCLDKLKLWVKNCFCPNYFIPEHNMFLGKINSDNNTVLLNVLNGIRCDGIDGITKYYFPNDNVNCRLLRPDSESSLYKVDFLFYRIVCVIPMPDISTCLKFLMLTESLIKSTSSTFIIEVCKYYHAGISQYAAQFLPPPTTPTATNSIHKRYHRHLQDGIKKDAVSGWLLYASFYYVTGQYNVTLKLADYVLSRCSPDMLLAGCFSYSEIFMNNYRRHVHSTMKLSDKFRIATVSNVEYAQQSSIMPMELQFEVKRYSLEIPPNVMSHCLRFLCYHHLSDITNRQRALNTLDITVNDIHVDVDVTNTISNSFTILGVCYEISGDKDAAYQCYDAALQCDGSICPSAEARKSKLLNLLV